MSVISFIKSKTFRNHFILAIAAGIALLWFSLKMLDVYTMHGKSITVPDLKGMEPEESQKILKGINLRQIVNDSIFDSTREKGTISSQNPLPGAEVKKNRTIYLTVVAILPEMIAMPDLTDLSLRQALAFLETHGLKAGRLEHVPNIARNAVLRQKINNVPIDPGTLVEKGTPIDLVLGSGVADTNVPVPLLIGKTRQEAINLLNLASLNIGQEVFLDEDDINVRVFRQSPSVIQNREFLPLGSTVDLYYRSVENFDFEEYITQTLSVPTPNLYGKSPEDVFSILQQMNISIGAEVFERNVPVQNARVYRQEPDFSNTPTIIRGSSINIWYRDINDFDN